LLTDGDAETAPTGADLTNASGKMIGNHVVFGGDEGAQ
jgi:hypothetical protein